MASALPCLVDVVVAIDGVQRGWLGGAIRAQRLAMGELSLRELVKAGSGLAPQVDEVVRLARDGVIEVMSATATELAAVSRWVGADAVSVAEWEMLALVLAGRARLMTGDGAVRRLASELGVEDRMMLFDAISGEVWPVLRLWKPFPIRGKLAERLLR